jgi:hypothetical protein
MRARRLATALIAFLIAAGIAVVSITATPNVHHDDGLATTAVVTLE